MILKNGKRIDGCSDTVPVGTLNPFLGLTPPAGYLICQGQLVSKQLYPELYAICGNTFGTATATEFYLPDLRGKTITGYKEGDSTFGVLGALIGNLTHTHSTGNHTLTINEMPSHGHSIAIDEAGTGEYWTLKVFNEERQTTPGYGTSLAGGGQAHNHGDTSSASSLQPSINLNWIVKAVMLIPVNSIVENSLTSTSTTNALSAAQGKILNDKIDALNIPDVINNLTSTSTTAALSAAQGKILNDKINTGNNYTGSETVVGTYYDGKPIYRRCWEGSGTDGSDIPNFINIAKIVDFGGMASVSGINRALPYYELYNNKRYGFTINLNGSNARFVIINNDTASSAFCWIWIEYTKTTD